MAFKLPELVQETTTTTGLGTYTLLGRVGGFRGFGDELSSGDTTLYCVFDTTVPPIYEINKGTWTSPDQLTRDTFIKSSTGSAINWGASVKNVVIGLPGKLMATLLDFDLAAGYVKLASGSPENLFSTQAVPIPLADGGTNAANAADARTQLSACDRALSEQTLLTTVGDLLYMNTGPAEARLPIGSNDMYLRVVSGKPSWVFVLGSHVAHTPTSPLTATTVQDALDQLSHGLSSVTVQSTAHTNITADTETLMNELNGLAIPGSPNGTKKYRVVGQITITGTTTGARAIVRVRAGADGDIDDTIITTHYATPNPASATYNTSIPILSKWWQPATGNKVGITLEIANSSAYDTVAADCWVYIEQMRNA